MRARVGTCRCGRARALSTHSTWAPASPGARRRLVEPGVFADQQPEDVPPTSNTTGACAASRPDRNSAARRTPCSSAVRACVGGDDACPASTEAALKRCCRHRLRPNIAALTELMRMPHHHVQGPRDRQRLATPAVQRLGAGAHEGRAQQQILGRVAAERAVREQHRRAPSRGGGAIDDRCVARDVAHRHVDLRGAL